MNLKLAVVGATGLVGQKIVSVLSERKFPYSELLLAASDASAGKQILVNSKSYTLLRMEELVERNPDIALFSAGSGPSLKWAPEITRRNGWVIDNSSAWRMHANVALVVPEINAHAITSSQKIIANPNCSTIQLVMALHALHRKNKIKRLVISTYQSVTGTGAHAVKQLLDERSGKTPLKQVYPHPIDLNILPQVDVFLNDGYTREEHKLMQETRKILESPEIAITATTVRVPVLGGHSESVNVQFEQAISLEEVRNTISESPGCKLLDAPEHSQYPMPLNVQEQDTVFVGRIRSDASAPHSFNLWIVADNLRKGAATNAVQIAEHLVNNWNTI